MNEYEMKEETVQKKQKTAVTNAELIKLIIKRAKNNTEYKKYSELSSMLTLNYYKRFGNLDQAIEFVYSLVENAQDIHALKQHYAAIVKEEKATATDQTEHAKDKLLNTLANDYRRRFGEKKLESYKVLVLQSWVNKIETVNELAILMDSILTVRDKLGNSWDYEVHVIPLLLEKAFSAEMLSEFSTAITNLTIGLSRRLKDSYLAVMTAVKILEFADSPKTVKMYIRDMVKDNSKKIDELNMELAVINADLVSRITQSPIARIKSQQVIDLTKQTEELMNGIDPKELMLESTKR